MAPTDRSTPLEFPESPEDLGPLSPDESSTTMVENILHDQDLELDFMEIDFDVDLDLDDIVVDDDIDEIVWTSRRPFRLDMDPEVLLEAFLDWELPLILEALQDHQ